MYQHQWIDQIMRPYDSCDGKALIGNHRHGKVKLGEGFIRTESN